MRPGEVGLTPYTIAPTSRDHWFSAHEQTDLWGKNTSVFNTFVLSGQRKYRELSRSHPRVTFNK